jgi:hypothetical protein
MSGTPILTEDFIARQREISLELFDCLWRSCERHEALVGEDIWAVGRVLIACIVTEIERKHETLNEGDLSALINEVCEEIRRGSEEAARDIYAKKALKA